LKKFLMGDSYDFHSGYSSKIEERKNEKVPFQQNF